MSKPKRRSLVGLLEQELVTSSRDNAVTLETESNQPAGSPALEMPPTSRRRAAVSSAANPSPAAKAQVEAASLLAPGARRRSTNDNTRHSYHASLYLPDEAQFALREIALTMRRAKPHDVMLEAMAEMFEKYNKGDLAKQCRARITSRDKAVT